MDVRRKPFRWRSFLKADWILKRARCGAVFEESRYAYREPYKGRNDFKKHLFRVIGDLEPSGEEHECAVYLERMPECEVMGAQYLAATKFQSGFRRNDKFYPDFVALLSDWRYLVVDTRVRT